MSTLNPGGGGSGGASGGGSGVGQNPGSGVVSAPAPAAAPAANITAPVVTIPVNGGINAAGQVWTGGPRNPALRSLFTNARSPMCYRSTALNHRIWARCEKGVEDCWQIKLSNTLPLSTCEPIVHDGLKDVGVDAVFWIDVNQKWEDLFLHPDAVPVGEIPVSYTHLTLPTKA